MTATLDPAALDQMLELGGGDRSFVVEMIDEYLEDSASLVEVLRGSSGEELRRAAHSLKSTSASVGAARLAALCHEVEQAGAAGADALADIRREHAAVAEELWSRRAAFA